MTKLFYIFPLVLILHVDAQICHYSCTNCTKQYYNYCMTCAQNYQFTLVQDPTQLQVQYRNGDQVTGICVGQTKNNVNYLGILLVVISLIGLFLSRGQKVFYIIFTMQTFGLFSFLQIAWLSPTSYVLDALQYFCVFNILGSSLKQTSWEIRKHSYYRLNSYYHQSSILKSLAILGVMNVVVFLLLIILPIFQVIRKNQCPNSFRCLICHSWVLDLIQRGLFMAFFLMIQETVLSIIVALYYSETIDTASIAITIVYGLMLIYLFIRTYMRRLKIFPNIFVQYQNYVKKIVYPLFIIVPQPYQYVLIIFMLVNMIFQLVFDGLLDLYELKSRMTIYKSLQIIIIIMGGASFIVDSVVNNYQSTLIVQIVLMVCILFLFVALIVEIVVATKERFSKKQQKVAVEETKTTKIISTNTTSRKNLQQGRLQITQQNIKSQVIDQVLQQQEEEEPKLVKIQKIKKLKSLKRVPKKLQAEKSDKRKQLQKRYGIKETIQ